MQDSLMRLIIPVLLGLALVIQLVVWIVRSRAKPIPDRLVTAPAAPRVAAWVHAPPPSLRPAAMPIMSYAPNAKPQRTYRYRPPAGSGFLGSSRRSIRRALIASVILGRCQAHLP